MAPLLARRQSDDAELGRRVAAGDAAAFAALDERYRRRLVRYAGSLLRRSEHDAEDVVQDVLIRAHAALRAGQGPEELRPWLFRLTRNRAIDEVRRARWSDTALEDDESLGLEDRRDQPEAVLRRKEALRSLVEDLADLPVRQRAALLAREADGLSPDEVARQLGVTVRAAQMLAVRARDNLVRTKMAREAPHEEIRAALLDAHERGVRPSEHVRRHLQTCAACRAYRQELRRLSTRLRALAPPVGFLPLAGLAKLLGPGAAAKGAAAGALVLAATGGVVVLGSQVLSPGDPAPFPLKGEVALVGRSVERGQALPPGTALVTARVRIPAGVPARGTRRGIELACPAGMRVTGMQDPEQRGLPLSYGLTRDTIIGHSSRATIRFSARRLDRPAEGVVGILCRRPDARGSIVSDPREPRPGDTPGRICVDSAYVYRSPGRTFVGTVSRGQPVWVERRVRSGRWVRVAQDAGMPGWVRASALCP